jgi:hypothetical protein
VLLTDPLEIDDLVLRVVYRFSCANCALRTEILEIGCVENCIIIVFKCLWFSAKNKISNYRRHENMS